MPEQLDDLPQLPLETRKIFDARRAASGLPPISDKDWNSQTAVVKEVVRKIQAGESSITLDCVACDGEAVSVCPIHGWAYCRKDYTTHVAEEHPAWPQLSKPDNVIGRSAVTIAGETVAVLDPGQRADFRPIGHPLDIVTVSHPVGSIIDHDLLPPEYLAAYRHGVAEERRATIDWLRKRCETNPPCDPRSTEKAPCQFCEVAHHIESR